MLKYVFVFLFSGIVAELNAQNILNRLKQKAEKVGERVIDKAVDDLLNGKTRPPETPAPEPAVQGKVQEKERIYSGKPIETPIPSTPDDDMIRTDTIYAGVDTVYHFNTSTITAKEFVEYALTLKGTPYNYGSTDPAYGLDCSGFITHVFNHFNIQVPRRSFDFKNAERKVKLSEAMPGDLVLFTGSNNLSSTPGHMGIIISKPGKPAEFIHSSSGANSVTTTALSNSYYKSRFLEVVRVF